MHESRVTVRVETLSYKTQWVHWLCRILAHRVHPSIVTTFSTTIIGETDISMCKARDNRRYLKFLYNCI